MTVIAENNPKDRIDGLTRERHEKIELNKVCPLKKWFSHKTILMIVSSVVHRKNNGKQM